MNYELEAHSHGGKKRKEEEEERKQRLLMGALFFLGKMGRT